nr:unnamed protein product [Callosobruchus analis]
MDPGKQQLSKNRGRISKKQVGQKKSQRNVKETIQQIECIQGDTATETEEQFGEFVNEDDVFKPRRMTCRTPPSNELEADEKSTTEAGKRIRTEDSPDTGDTRKRRCWEESSSECYQSSKFKEIDQTNAPTNGGISELVSKFFEEIDQINAIALKIPETFQEKRYISSATYNIHKLLTYLVVKISDLEKQNLILQSKIDVNSERKNNISSRTNERYQQADREGTQSGTTHKSRALNTRAKPNNPSLTRNNNGKRHQLIKNMRQS